MKKVLVIAGPTGSGKTKLSIELAKKYHTEIISGDSIQVYKGLDIGSGKIKPIEMEGIPHHLIDILEPNEQYTVVEFQQMARKLIEDIEPLPMIVGGTGLYLKSCLYDYEFNEEEGDSIDEEFLVYSNEELYEMLKKSDPLQAEKIHPNNRHRLLRSLTKQNRAGKPQSEIEAAQKHEPIYDIFVLGCTYDREVLYERINQRVEGMFEEGLKEEVEGLLEKGYSFSDPGFRGIGYQEWRAYFENEATIEEVKKEIQKHSRQYAKKQYTWLNHQMKVHWLNPTDQKEKEDIFKEIDTWFHKN